MKTVEEGLFKDFKCIADKCPMTCCSGWQIVIDDESLNAYNEYEGPLNKDFDENVDFDEGCFCQKENRDCAFLNESGLCNMILKGSEDLLCDTCRLFPRHCEEFEDVREWSMSVSCPEVARLLFESEKYLEFTSKEDDEEDPLEDEFEDFDIFLFDKLSEARDVYFDICKNGELNILEKTGLLLELSKRLQAKYDTGDIFLMEEDIKTFSNEDFIKKTVKDKALDIETFYAENKHKFDGLTRMTDEFGDYLKLFKSDFISRDRSEKTEFVLSNLLMSYIYTYLLGSVYNGFIFANTYLCVFCVLFTEILVEKKASVTEHELSENEILRIMYLLSRECEHADENVNALLERFDELCQ